MFEWLNAPLMRQGPPDVHYCGTWWPPTFPYRRPYLAIGPVPSLAGPFPCPIPRRESVGGRNSPALCLSTPESGLASLGASHAAESANVRVPSESGPRLVTLERSLHSQKQTVRPDGAEHQWRKVPPRELSVDLVADERGGWVTGRLEAS